MERVLTRLSRAFVVASFLVAPLVLHSLAHAQDPLGGTPHALDGVAPAITIPLDCVSGIRWSQLMSRFGELRFHPHPQREPAVAIALAGDFLAMAERCPEEPGHTWTLLYAGLTLALGGEARWAAGQFLRAQDHARSQREAAGFDGGLALLGLEAEAAMGRAIALARLFEFNDAIAAYHSVLDDPVFATSNQPHIQERYLEVFRGVFALHRLLGDRRALDVLVRRLRRSLAAAPWPNSVEFIQGRRELLAMATFYRAILAEHRRPRQVLRDLDRFLTEFSQEPSAASMRLEARWRIFQLRVDSGARSTRGLRTSLLHAVLEAAAHPIENTVGMREVLAERARFRLIDEQMADLIAHLRESRSMTRAALARGIELANAVAVAHATELTGPDLSLMVRGIARTADAYALLVRALDESGPASEPEEWRHAARTQLACHVLVLDRLALGHARLRGMDAEWFVTSINRLALTPMEDVLACGDELPPAASAFPVVPLDSPPTAPLGLRLPFADPLHAIPALVDAPE